MDLPCHRCSTCGALTAGPCLHCRARRDEARPNANSRGYCSKAWRRFRAVQLARSPLCVRCLAAGTLAHANEVDHIRPVTGPEDPTFYDFTAVQSLCARCHSRKTAVEDSTFARSS